ncbi:Mrr restriction system protein [anaerobic digester metagenome]
MGVPDFQTIMLPLLKITSDCEKHSLHEVIEELSEEFNLSHEDMKELLPSGKQPIFDNRVGWARTYLKKAGLIEYKRRGYSNITERGLAVLKESPEKITIKFLKQYPEFMEFISVTNKKLDKTESYNEDLKTPIEILENGYKTINENLAIDLLDQIKNCSPSFFENLVVDLLLKMGYGGSRADAGKAIGKTNDNGIDGIIKEDKLGLDVIYIQAKRWENTVGRPEIQKFAGALLGQQAKKGIFITTSDYSKNARDYVSNIESKVILIGGEELSKLMIDHNVGVSTVNSYEIKRIDSDYFIEE